MKKLLYTLLFPLMFALPMKAQSDTTKVTGGVEVKVESKYLTNGFVFNDGATSYLLGNSTIKNGKNSLYFMAMQSNNLEREEGEPNNVEHTLVLEGTHSFDKNTSLTVGAAQTWLYGIDIPYVNEVYVSGTLGPATLKLVKGLSNIGGWYGTASVSKDVNLQIGNVAVKPNIEAKVGIMHNYFINHSGPQDLTVKMGIPLLETKDVSITATGKYQFNFNDSENTNASAGIEFKFFD